MLSGVARRLTAEEKAREPRSLGVLAFFDGYSAGAGQGRHFEMPRRLTAAEERSWRDGFAEGRTERVCHSWHGFIPCPHDHPVYLRPEEHACLTR